MKSVDKSYWGNEICGATVATRYNKYTCYVVNSIAYGVTPRNRKYMSFEVALVLWFSRLVFGQVFQSNGL